VNRRRYIYPDGFIRARRFFIFGARAGGASVAKLAKSLGATERILLREDRDLQYLVNLAADEWLAERGLIARQQRQVASTLRKEAELSLRSIRHLSFLSLPPLFTKKELSQQRYKRWYERNKKTLLEREQLREERLARRRELRAETPRACRVCGEPGHDGRSHNSKRRGANLHHPWRGRPKGIHQGPVLNRK
jgi:hypothetical protein